MNDAIYQCIRCEWLGVHEAKIKVKTEEFSDWKTDVCPMCSNEDFYVFEIKKRIGRFHNNAEIIESQFDFLVALEQLNDFFINFHNYEEILEEMQSESREWKHIWDQLNTGAQVEADKTGWFPTISAEILWEKFNNKLSRHTQALLLNKLLENTEGTQKNIQMSIKIERLKAKQQKKGGKTDERA